MNKVLLSIIGAVIFYLASMVDMRPFTTERMVDCQVGAYTFTLKAKDCR